MTSKERIEAALHGNPVDHIPFSPFLAYVWEHFPQSIQDLGQLAFHQRIGADPLWRGAPCAVKAIPPAEIESRNTEGNGRIECEIRTPVGTLHQAWARSESGNTTFLVEHHLKTEQDYKTQMWIEENTTLTYDPVPVNEHFAGNGREGLSMGMLIPRGKSAFQKGERGQCSTSDSMRLTVVRERGVMSRMARPLRALASAGWHRMFSRGRVRGPIIIDEGDKCVKC